MPIYKINKIDLVKHVATNVSDNLDGLTPIENIPLENIIIKDSNNNELDFIDQIGVYKIELYLYDTQNNETFYTLDTYVTLSPDVVAPIINYNANVLFDSIDNRLESTMYIDYYNAPTYYITPQNIIDYLALESVDDRGTSTLTMEILHGSNLIIGDIYNENLYVLKITALDVANNSTYIEIYLDVTLSPDVIPPVIILDNSTFNIVDSRLESSILLDFYTNQTLTLSDIETYLISSITDNRVPFTITPTITIENAYTNQIVNQIYTPGIYLINILAEDVALNTDQVIVWLSVGITNDTIAPTITLTSNVVSNVLVMTLSDYTIIQKSDILVSAVHSIFDQVDGYITPNINMIDILSGITNIPDINSVGSYSLIISAYDNAGNISTKNITLLII